jgi:hypothetical protein
MQEIQDLIGYDEIIENSMRSVIYETFKKIEKTGLPGKHYFILTFMTNYSGAEISKALKEKYKDEMTIVVQYQYKDLKVEHEKFSISLSFDGKYEKLVVPYRSITSFADPSMNFGLKFSVSYDELQSGEGLEFADESEGANKNTSKKKKNNLDLSAKVVSLDAFRQTKNNDNKS